MAKSTVIPFEFPSKFSPEPLTEVIQAGAKELLKTAIQAEVSAFLAAHSHLLEEGDYSDTPTWIHPYRVQKPDLEMIYLPISIC